VHTALHRKQRIALGENNPGMPTHHFRYIDQAGSVININIFFMLTRHFDSCRSTQRTWYYSLVCGEKSAKQWDKTGRHGKRKFSVKTNKWINCCLYMVCMSM